jgi:hypothetical protein
MFFFHMFLRIKFYFSSFNVDNFVFLTCNVYFFYLLLHACTHILVETHLNGIANAKEAFNHVLQKNTNSLTTYTQVLKDFVESWRFFFNPPQLMTSTCSHMNVGICLELVNADLRPLPIKS